MQSMKKLACLWIVFTVSACQSFPISLPISTIVPSNTPGPTPTNTPLPTPTPLPTMEPVVRIDTGDQALFFGDFDLAREQYPTTTPTQRMQRVLISCWVKPITD